MSGAGIFSGMNRRTGIDGTIVPFVRVAQFFDRPAIINKLGKAKLRYYSRSGGYIRRVARTSMRRVGKKQRERERQTGWETPSRPGSPPFARSGELREGVWYGYDAFRDSCVVGPTLFRKNRPRRGLMTVPALHEYGGRRFNPRWGRDSIYPARPYMEPALEKAQRKLPLFYAEAFRKGDGGITRRPRPR